MQIMRHGETRGPEVEKSDAIAPFEAFTARRYFAFDKIATASVEAVFGKVDFIDSTECAFITDKMSEKSAEECESSMAALGFSPLSTIRLL